jgi:hypothetical protein
MNTTRHHIGATASEQMFFHGAPLAHVVLYYELARSKRLAQLLVSSRGGHRRFIEFCAAPLADSVPTPVLCPEVAD